MLFPSHFIAVGASTLVVAAPKPPQQLRQHRNPKKSQRATVQAWKWARSLHCGTIYSPQVLIRGKGGSATEPHPLSPTGSFLLPGMNHLFFRLISLGRCVHAASAESEPALQRALENFPQPFPEKIKVSPMTPVSTLRELSCQSCNTRCLEVTMDCDGYQIMQSGRGEEAKATQKTRKSFLSTTPVAGCARAPHYNSP